MEIISAPTDINAPLHYFPRMSTMAKSLSPPGLEQLENDVDISSSPTTSYSCPILSSISPDRLKMFPTAAGTPGTTVSTETTPSPLKAYASVTTTNHNNGLPPLDLSTSPEKLHSPGNVELNYQDQVQDASQVAVDIDDNTSDPREGWVQMLQQMASFYNSSTSHNSSNGTSLINCMLNNNNTDSPQDDNESVNSGLPSDAINISSSTTHGCNNADSQQFDSFLRFQSMLNDMNKHISNQNQPSGTGILCGNENSLFAGTNVLSNLPESLKSMFPFMNSSNDINAKPGPVQSAATLLPEEQNLRKMTAFPNDQSHISPNFSGNATSFPSQNSILSSECNLMLPKPGRAPSTSAPLDFTASFLAMLAASHKASSSCIAQRNPVTSNSNLTNSHTGHMMSAPPFSPSAPMSSAVTTSACMSANTPTYTVPSIPSNLATADPLAQMNASMFDINSNRQAVPDLNSFPINVPHQLSENRELLYQLGQRFMAMATLSDFMNSASYPPPNRSNNDTVPQYSNSQPSLSTTSPNTFSNNPIEAAVAAAATAMINQYGAPFIPGFPKITTDAIHQKHNNGVSALYSTSTASISSPLSSPHGIGSTSSNSPPFTVGSMGPTKFGVDKSPLNQKPLQSHHALVNSGATPPGLSGVSMRGNQKYSAYYQNQRKQGFSAASTGTSGNMAGEYFYGNRNANVIGPTISSRRAGLPTNNPVLNSRYGNRRFRGNISSLPTMSPHSVDSKSGNQRTPGNRNTSAGLSGVTYSGYSQPGIGIKSLSTTSSLFNPGLGGNNSSFPLSKGHGSTESPMSSGQPNRGGASEAVGPIPSRHKDTAFLCSCGNDFENLYVFIIHMKDTGHKPKSDNCDKDIPKLVRGQDMWINSETEQTREILRCMRCHQSFRSLPELTLHMMKTNHYSEIVYNDSGRLVFVNPDEHKRGPSTSSNNNPYLSSPGKVSPGSTASTQSARRGWKTLNYTPTTSTGTGSSFWSNGRQASALSDHGENTRHNSDRREMKRLNPCFQRSAEAEELYNNTEKHIESIQSADKVSETKTLIPCGNAGLSGIVSPTTKAPSLPTELPDEVSHRIGQESPNSMKSDSSTNSHNNQGTGCGEINVLKQIETFVENSLPSKSKCLSVKTDSNTSSASSSFTSAPLSALTPTSEGAPGCWSSLPNTQHCSEASTSSSLIDSRIERKRRHSEANSATDTSCHNNPLENSISEQQDAKIRATDSELNLIPAQPTATSNPETGSPVLQTVTPSPSKVTSTTGDSDIGAKRKQKPQQLRNPVESPLSSLQKLVDTTTHKPVAPSAAFSEPHTPHSHLPLSATLTVTRSNAISTRPHSRTINSQYQSARHNINTVTESSISRNIVNTTSSNSINNQSIISAAEDSEMPALSALYAYVERSSPCQSQESIQNMKDSVSPDGSEPNKPLDKLEFNLPRSMNSPLSYIPNYSSKPSTPSLTSSPSLETMSMANQLTPPILQQAAFCAAMFSNLTATPRSMSSQAQSAHMKDTPLRDISTSLPTVPDMLHPSRAPVNNTSGGESSDLTNNWWRILQNLFATCSGTQFPMIPPIPEVENNQMCDREKGNAKSMVNDSNILREGNRNQFTPVSNRAIPPCSIPVNNSSVSTCNKSSSSSTTVPSQMMTPLANYRTPLPATTFSHRFNSNLANQSLGIGPGVGSGLMSSIITKKAKCHFCGKPFANKGQVRLHISKNKCPCLLQQSCHVAALVATFGGDPRRGGKQSFQTTSSHNSGISKSSLINQFPPAFGNHKAPQSHLIHPGISSCNPDDSTGAPSALTLLKERFQNFDLSHASSQPNQPNQSIQQTSNFHTFTSSSSLTSQSASPVAACSGTGSLLPVNVPSSECDLSTMTSWLPPAFPNFPNMDLSSPNSAANANHLAAMALLAQTLVHLTSANSTQGATGFSNSKLEIQQQPLYQQPGDMTDNNRQQASLDALMPFLADSNGLDRETLLNSAKWLTQLTNSASRGVTTKYRTPDWTDQSGQSTCVPRTVDSSEGMCDTQLSQSGPTTTTPNGHL